MFKLFKPTHTHNWELIAVNDTYHTSYTDTNRVQYWQMRFYKCACGKRKYDDDRPGTYVTHSGMEKSKANWIDAGVVPLDSYHPNESKHYIKIDDTPKEQLDPLEQLTQTVENLCAMMSVIKQDYNLEKKYPKLRSIAEHYNQELSKYRTFESLKDDNDGT